MRCASHRHLQQETFMPKKNSAVAKCDRQVVVDCLRQERPAGNAVLRRQVGSSLPSLAHARDGSSAPHRTDRRCLPPPGTCPRRNRWTKFQDAMSTDHGPPCLQCRDRDLRMGRIGPGRTDDRKRHRQTQTSRTDNRVRRAANPKPDRQESSPHFISLDGMRPRTRLSQKS
jgi:hypothetical protein